MKLNIRPVAAELVADENKNHFYKTAFEPLLLTPKEFRTLLESLDAENIVVVNIEPKESTQ